MKLTAKRIVGSEQRDVLFKIQRKEYSRIDTHGNRRVTNFIIFFRTHVLGAKPYRTAVPACGLAVLACETAVASDETAVAVEKW